VGLFFIELLLVHLFDAGFLLVFQIVGLFIVEFLLVCVIVAGFLLVFRLRELDKAQAGEFYF